MICNCCNKDLIEKDFLLKQTCCFRCVYLKKIKNKKKEKPIKVCVCRNCKREFTKNLEIKKRQRTVFCSDACAEIGYKDMKKNHWTRRLRSNFPMTM